MKRYLLILLFCTQTILSFASCLSCWTLTPVSITLSDSTKVDGYVRWNEEWIEKPAGNFKKDFFTHHKVPYDTVYFFKSIVFLDSLFSNTKIPFVLENQFLKLHISGIKTILKRQDDFKNIIGAGEIAVLTQSAYEFLLKNKPIATHVVEGVAANLIYFSFNKSVNKNKLIEISSTATYLDKEKLEKQGVYIFVEQWD